jgi:ankyrin repeat protein
MRSRPEERVTVVGIKSWGMFLVGVLFVPSFGAPIPAHTGAPLADAAERGDHEAVRSLLQEHADVNAAQGDGATALHWAVYRDDAEIAGLLIPAGANVNVRNNYGVTPLVLASKNGNATILRELLKAGADPNAAVRNNETPLMFAARTAHEDAVNALLSADAKVNAQEGWNGQTALMWAADAGQTAVVKALLDHGADIHARSHTGATPLLFAARHGNLDTVNALLAAGADVNEARPDGATPLLVAVINGHADLVDLLLATGANPNAEGGLTQITVEGTRAKAPPLKYRQLGYTKRDSEGVSPGNNWGRPLQAAVHVANWHTSDDIISVQIDRIRVIKALLAHGADVNGRSPMEEPRWPGARYRRPLQGATAFLLAAKSADVEVMRLLLDHGADPSINTIDNITPLMAAAGIAWASNQDRATEAQVLEAVKLLVDELHANVNAVSDIGETPMHAAAYRGANSIVQYLFDKGAKLDVVAKDGRTPLIIADGVEYGNSFAAQPQTAVLLRKLGAPERQCPNKCIAAIPNAKTK